MKDDKEKFNNMVLFAKRVRDAQKEYFKTRTKEALTKAKNLEATLDKALDFYTNNPLI